MKPDQKASVMADFRDRRFDVLVATSVIEVGIDVPNATLMTILDAENFDLPNCTNHVGGLPEVAYRVSVP